MYYLKKPFYYFRIVLAYADTAVTLLLPELEKGLFDDNWRIRYSSVQLLGKV